MFLLDLVILTLCVFFKGVFHPQIFAQGFHQKKAFNYSQAYLNCISINRATERKVTLRKIPSFHLNSRRGNFVEGDSLRKVSANRPKFCGICSFPQNFHIRKSGEITVFHAVKMSQGTAEAVAREYSAIKVLLQINQSIFFHQN